MDISIINSGSGNIGSLKNMLNYLGFECNICDCPEKLNTGKFIFLPGVGSFDGMVNSLKKKNFYNFLKHKNNYKDKMLIGICVGMHVLFEKSEEGKEAGLELINGKVKKFKNINLKLPHMGWNSVVGEAFYENCNKMKFYFAHSYYVECEANKIIAYSFYGKNFPSIIQSGNILGIQFHPEKSHVNGMELLRSIIQENK